MMSLESKARTCELASGMLVLMLAVPRMPVGVQAVTGLVLIVGVAAVWRVFLAAPMKLSEDEPRAGRITATRRIFGVLSAVGLSVLAVKAHLNVMNLLDLFLIGAFVLCFGLVVRLHDRALDVALNDLEEEEARPGKV